MKLSILRNFLVIAQCGSFTKAAEQLLVSQPSLSRQIMELEEELGVRLFERSKSCLQLSKAGELLLEEAAEIVARCDRLPNLFLAAGEDTKLHTVREVLRIGYPKFFDMEAVYRAADAVRKDTPGAEIMLMQDGIPELRQGLLSNRYDAVFSLRAYFEGVPELRILYFRENFLQLAVPAEHPLAARKRVKIEELRDEPFVLLRREFSPIIVDRILSLGVRSGFSLHAAAYVNTAEEGLRLAGAGQGIAFLHSGMRMEGLDKRFNVRFLDLEETDADVPLALVYKEKNAKETLRRLIGKLGLAASSEGIGRLHSK